MKPFDPTKTVQQRNGRPARILATNSQVCFEGILQPLVVEVLNSSNQYQVETFTIEGRFRVFESDLDLENIPVKHKLEGWVNFYPEEDVPVKKRTIYFTPELAAAYAGPHRIACLDLSKYNIEFEEGEGL